MHGYPDHQGVWDAVIPHLLPHADVLTYDVRGVGRSQAPASRAGYRLEHLRADLDAVVDTASTRAGDVHLLAHDWGSIQAWQGVTADGPASRVESFTSISGPCLDHVLRWYARSLTAPGGTGERLSRAGTLGRQLASSLYIPFFRVPPLAEGAIRSGVLPRFLAWAGEAVEALSGGTYIRSTRELVGGLEWYRANIAARHDATESTNGPRRTDVPTLVVVPTRDPYVRSAMATCGEPFTARFTTRSLEAGHWVILSHPQQVAQLVLQQMSVSPRR